ncbi:MAG TPA: AbrB/MazE/SpoVT family DNA-binding domain-containing protein [Candidatus Binatia bacterium]
MRRRVQRWGNSLAVRIPTDVAKACDLTEGTELEVRNEKGTVVLVPDRPRRRRYALADLVNRITRRNRHEAIEHGRPVGREIW